MASFAIGIGSLRTACAKPIAQNPAESRVFSGRPTLCGESLCGSRLSGGGGSLGRTRLLRRFPDHQGKYREFHRNRTLLAEPTQRFLSVSTFVATDSLRPGTGNSFSRTGKSWEIWVEALKWILPLPRRTHGRYSPDLRRAAGMANPSVSMRPSLGRVLAHYGIVVICNSDETRRTVRVIDDPDLAKRAIREEIIGREVELGPHNAIRWI